MGIKDWPASERPRERLIEDGAHSLSDAELLAVFLRTGVRGKSAVQLARDTVEHFGSLRGLFGASLVSFSAVHGMGSAKFAQLQAVLELARRAIVEDLQTGQALHTPHAVKDYLRLALGNLGHESFHVLFLDVKNRLITTQEMFRGTLTHIRLQYLRNNFLKKVPPKSHYFANRGGVVNELRRQSATSAKQILRRPCTRI